MIYFDNAATTPMHPEVIETMHQKMQEFYGNPSSSHAAGRKVKSEIEYARRSIAKCMGCEPGEIYFTSGGTESDNIVLHNSSALGCKQIITSKIEHHAVLHTAQEIEKTGMAVKYVNLTKLGHVDINHLEELLKSAPKSMVSLMHANNEIGNKIDLLEVGELCKKYNALFHSDTVQTIGYHKFNLKNTPIDFVVGAAHKFNGPKGIGFLFKRKGLALNSMQYGGAQEKGIRCGTENVLGIIGMAKALDIATGMQDEKIKKIAELKFTFAKKLKEVLPEIGFNGDWNGKSNPTVLNVTFPMTENNSMLLFNLDIEGLCASSGSACSSGSNVGSHVLAEVPKSSDGPSIRFSFGMFNTLDEVDEAIAIISNVLDLECANS